MRGGLRPASESELRWLWPAVRAARLCDTAAEFEATWREAPWRLQVSDRREAALLARWREHLDLLAVRGLWCAERRVEAMMHELGAVARAHGFGRLLSPLVPEEAARPYLEAGMTLAESIIALRHDDPASAPRVQPPDGLRLGIATAEDLAAIATVDSRAFPDFWRYDLPTLSRYLERERCGVAQAEDGIIGYTLSISSGSEGTLGRLAVDPAWQGRGVGSLLLADALHYMSRQGARTVTLSTQTDNTISRRLYAKAGFRELAGRLLFFQTEDLRQGRRDG